MAPLPFSIFASATEKLKGTKWQGGKSWGAVRFDESGRRASYTNETGGIGHILVTGVLGDAGTYLGSAHSSAIESILVGEWYHNEGKGGLFLKFEREQLKLLWGPRFLHESIWQQDSLPLRTTPPPSAGTPPPNPPVPPVTAPPSAPSGADLVSAIQRELKRVGCYKGEVDGRWRGGSIEAMAKFNGKVQASFNEPQVDLLEALKKQKTALCLNCKGGETETDGQCVPKPLAKQPTSEPPQPQTRRSPDARRPKAPIAREQSKGGDHLRNGKDNRGVPCWLGGGCRYVAPSRTP
jgi:hypothetical protein